MRVGIFLGGLDPAYAGGLKTYAVGLVKGLSGNRRGHQTVVFIGDGVREELAQRMVDTGPAEFVPLSPLKRGIFDRLTMLPGLDRLHVPVRNWEMRRVSELIATRCDVVLFPLCFMPVYRLSIPSIVSFHDLQHERYPSFFSWQQLRSRRVQFGATFRYGTVLQASSEAMKKEALEIYGDRVRENRIAIIPEGVDFAAFAAEAARCGSEYSVPDEFVLYPAQMWHHKNHLRLLRSIHDLRMREGIQIPLVLTGAEYEAGPAIRKFVSDRGLDDQVHILGKVPYSVLRSLYQRASYVLSASLHESNCLPILEAAASGTPMIVADIPPNRESARVFKLRIFDPLDIASMTATLSEAWRNREQNQEAVRANREAARRFDWTVIADMYLQQAERAVAARGGESASDASSPNDVNRALLRDARR